MKNSIKMIMAFALLTLASCGVNSPSSSSSETTSTSSNETDTYLNQLEKKAVFYNKKRQMTVTKDSTQYKYQSDIDTLDSADKIEHRHGTATAVASYSDNDDTTSTSYDIYETADETYTEGYDNKYAVIATSRSDFSGYTFSYDYSVATNLAITHQDYIVILSGDIAADGLSTFLGSDSLSGVTDFAFSAELTTDASTLNGFTFSYTQEGYSVSIDYTVSTLSQTVTLPTV